MNAPGAPTVNVVWLLLVMVSVAGVTVSVVAPDTLPCVALNL